MLLLWWLTLPSHWMPSLGQASKYWLSLGTEGSAGALTALLPDQEVCLLFVSSITTPTSALPPESPPYSLFVLGYACPLDRFSDRISAGANTTTDSVRHFFN